MLKRWDTITTGYFNRKHPYALPIFDDFGLDEKDNYYYDTSGLNKTEADARNKNVSRIIIETIAENAIYGNAKTMYMACPITSGLYASEWVAKRNAANDFEPLKTITTTHKLSRHMGPLMGKLVTGPNVRDNLLRGALAMDGNPDLHPLMPVVREMVVKHMSENADFSASQKYEDVDFMAKWYIKIDQCASLVFDGPLTFSRSTDKEINRALLIQAGLHPLRPQADMNITDINGQEVPTNTIYKRMLDTLKYQIGSGIHPKESLTVLLRMNDMFDHLQGKENKISAAREAAGMSKFPDKVHPAMQRWVTHDAKAFQKLREEVEFLAKEYCVSVLSNAELAQLDDKYQQWKDNGFGQMPSYKDGMSPNLRKKLDLCMDDAGALENYYDHVMPHKNEQDADALSQSRDELIELTQELVHDFDRITPRNNGHWNPKLNDIDTQHIIPLKLLATKLERTSPSNHKLLVDIALEIKEHIHSVKNTFKAMLDDQAISKLRAGSRFIAVSYLNLQDSVKYKPASTKAQTAMRQYTEGFEPFSKENEPAVFNDEIFDKLSDREQAVLPVLVGAEETTFPSLNQPYTIGISIDTKAFASTGKVADAAMIKSLKELYGAAGMDEVSGMNAEALAYTIQAYDYIAKLFPGQIIHGTLGDSMVHKAVEDYPEAIAKKGDSIRLSSAAQMLHHSKFSQLRDDKVFFGAGWASSENEVQTRVRAHEMQLRWLKRDHGVMLDIFTLSKDLSKAPANPQPDSLFESIMEIDNFIQSELKKGRDVPYKITLGLARLLEIHVMIEDPTIQKDRLDQEQQFTVHQIAPSLMSYMRDERKNKLGNMNTPDGIYSRYNDSKTGLFATTNLLKDIPSELLKEKAMGLNYTQMQKEVCGKHDHKTVQKPSDDQWQIDQGLHRA